MIVSSGPRNPTPATVGPLSTGSPLTSRSPRAISAEITSNSERGQLRMGTKFKFYPSEWPSVAHVHPGSDVAAPSRAAPGPFPLRNQAMPDPPSTPRRRPTARTRLLVRLLTSSCCSIWYRSRIRLRRERGSERRAVSGGSWRPHVICHTQV